MTKIFAAITVCLLVGTFAYAQENAPVSRADYNQLKASLKAEFDAQLKSERQQFEKDLADLKAQMGSKLEEQAATRCNFPEPSAEPSGKDLLSPILGTPVVASPGISKLTLTGGASATYINSGWSNDFSASFNPIFLWEINDRVRVEGDVVFSTVPNLYYYPFNNTDTSRTELQTAEISYDLCHYVTLGAGRFANPANYFETNLRKDWVNKLPDAPWVFPLTFIDGVQLHGAIPLGSTLLTYAAFAGDMTGGGQEAGTHLGFQPLKGLEIGYGIEILTGSFDRMRWNLDMTVQTADLNYIKDLDFLKGTVDVHAQWGGMTNGYNLGYGQLSYRPTHLKSFLANLEPVVRYQRQGSGPGRFEYWDFGLDYWITDRTVIKGAYEVGQFNQHWWGGPFFIQVATGF